MRSLMFTFVLLSCADLTMAASDADYRCRDEVAPPRVHEGRELRVASLNIAHGRGSSLNQMLIGQSRIENNLDSAAFLMTETGAHVIALQELDVDSRWSGGFDHAERLLRTSHHECVALGMHAKTWLYQFGTALLSGMELTQARIKSFEPTPPTTTKGLVAATLQWREGAGTRSVRLASVHLDFSRKSVRGQQLADIIESINESPVPIILMGDFNEQWHSQDSVVRRLVEEAGMIAYEPESDELATYKDKRLDWILLSSELEFVSYRVLDDEISDHRLIVADVRWRNDS
jgi:endonuclease/exonuclease/phosphatase family metal-dependent hydrolase